MYIFANRARVSHRRCQLSSNVRPHVNTLHKLNRLAVAAPLVLALGVAVAQSSKDYASMGLATWSAFECSSLASKSKQSKEQERLFLFGFKQGQTFVDAVRAGKVDKKDMNSEVPIGVLFLLQGPSTDFILGRIYEAAQDEALKDVFGPAGQMNSNELQLVIAQNKFRKSNCSLLGAR